MPLLGMGTGLGFGSRAPAFTPAALLGYVDSPFSFAQLRATGKLWQNTAMTIPAIADGDPIRRAVCGAVNYDAPSDAARPLLWAESGGKWSAAFDAIDDILITTSTLFTLNQFRLCAVACIRTANTAGSIAAMGNNGGTGSYAFGLLNSAGTSFFLSRVGSSIANFPCSSANSWRRYLVHHNSTQTQSTYQDNVVLSSANYNVSTLAAGGASIGGLNGLADKLPIRVAGLIFTTALMDDATRVQIDDYLLSLIP